jgi:hypothetical protein
MGNDLYVVGMTTWIGQRKNHLPATIHGIRMTTSQQGRLGMKHRLRQ